MTHNMNLLKLYTSYGTHDTKCTHQYGTHMTHNIQINMRHACVTNCTHHMGHTWHKMHTSVWDTHMTHNIHINMKHTYVANYTHHMGHTWWKNAHIITGHTRWTIYRSIRDTHMSQIMHIIWDTHDIKCTHQYGTHTMDTIQIKTRQISNKLCTSYGTHMT